MSCSNFFPSNFRFFLIFEVFLNFFSQGFLSRVFVNFCF